MKQPLTILWKCLRERRFKLHNRLETGSTRNISLFLRFVRIFKLIITATYFYTSINCSFWAIRSCDHERSSAKWPLVLLSLQVPMHITNRSAGNSSQQYAPVLNIIATVVSPSMPMLIIIYICLCFIKVILRESKSVCFLLLFTIRPVVTGGHSGAVLPTLLFPLKFCGAQKYFFKTYKKNKSLASLILYFSATNLKIWLSTCIFLCSFKYLCVRCYCYSSQLRCGGSEDAMKCKIDTSSGVTRGAWGDICSRPQHVGGDILRSEYYVIINELSNISGCYN